MTKFWIHYIGETPLGPIWISGSDRGLSRLEIGIDEDQFRRLSNAGSAEEDQAEAAEPARQIQEYLTGQRREFDLLIDWSAMTPFQQQVLRLVAAIPYGETTTYGELARRLGKPGAARAVGRANATNPLALVIPCHRVVGADGSLRGYGAAHGIQTKRWLLDLEQCK